MSNSELCLACQPVLQASSGVYPELHDSDAVDRSRLVMTPLINESVVTI